MDTSRGVLRSVGSLRAERERDLRQRFGGVSWGAAFIGFVVAVFFTLALGAILYWASVEAGHRWDARLTAANALVVSVRPAFTGPWVLGSLLALFLAFLVGGHTAGRMARFDGAANGFAVFLWAVLLPVVALAALILRGVALPALTGSGVLLLLAVAAAALLGALFGGSLGAASHRRVDAEADAGVRGFEGAVLVDSEGRKSGRVERSYVDDSGSVSHVEARLGTLSPRHRLVPVNSATVVDRELRVPYTEREILGSPDIGRVRESIDQGTLDLVRGYYGSLRRDVPAPGVPPIGEAPAASTVAERRVEEAAPPHPAEHVERVERVSEPARPETVHEVRSEPLTQSAEVRDHGDVVEVPIVEEELVRRPVVKEVVRVQKTPVEETRQVETELRREDVEVKKEGEVTVEDHRAKDA